MVYILLDLVNLKQMTLVIPLRISTLLALERAGISNSLVPRMTLGVLLPSLLMMAADWY